MKALLLCADDYGLSEPVNRGIEQLAAAGRLTDVSCISNGPAWRSAAQRIDARRTRLGLHLNLTEGQPLSPTLAALWPQLPPLPQLLVMAHTKRLPEEALWTEMVAQLAAFEHAAGRAPAHIDGHQHVHHLPQLRGLLLELMRSRKGLRARHTGHVQGPGFAVKRLLIEGTGGRALGRELESRRVAQNSTLFGVYDFAVRDYRGLVQRWLAALPAQGALLFCHPGEAAPDDAIAPARARELAYFASDDFTADLAVAGVSLAASAREGPVAVDGKRQQKHR
jgi:predicted glycoside hydrolase/deacetylase ChbG (UPF0249 family)